MVNWSLTNTLQMYQHEWFSLLIKEGPTDPVLSRICWGPAIAWNISVSAAFSVLTLSTVGIFVSASAVTDTFGSVKDRLLPFSNDGDNDNDNNNSLLGGGPSPRSSSPFGYAGSTNVMTNNDGGHHHQRNLYREDIDSIKNKISQCQNFQYRSSSSSSSSNDDDDFESRCLERNCPICLVSLEEQKRSSSKKNNMMMPPLDQDVVLPASTATGPNHHDNNENDLTIVQLKSCSHVFHEDCLSVWLQRSSSCPCCRRDLWTVPTCTTTTTTSTTPDRCEQTEK